MGRTSRDGRRAAIVRVERVAGRIALNGAGGPLPFGAGVHNTRDFDRSPYFGPAASVADGRIVR